MMGTCATDANSIGNTNETCKWQLAYFRFADASSYETFDRKWFAFALKKTHFLALRVWFTFSVLQRIATTTPSFGGIQFESTSGGCIAPAAVSGASTHGKYLEPVEPGCTARVGSRYNQKWPTRLFLGATKTILGHLHGKASVTPIFGGVKNLQGWTKC